MTVDSLVTYIVQCFVLGTAMSSIINNRHGRILIAWGRQQVLAVLCAIRQGFRLRSYKSINVCEIGLNIQNVKVGRTRTTYNVPFNMALEPRSQLFFTSCWNVWTSKIIIEDVMFFSIDSRLLRLCNWSVLLLTMLHCYRVT